jgi:hypothetical protein
MKRPIAFGIIIYLEFPRGWFDFLDWKDIIFFEIDFLRINFKQERLVESF